MSYNVGNLLCAKKELKIVINGINPDEIERQDIGSLFLIYDVIEEAGKTKLYVLLCQETGSLSEWDELDLEIAFALAIPS